MIEKLTQNIGNVQTWLAARREHGEVLADVRAGLNEINQFLPTQRDDYALTLDIVEANVLGYGVKPQSHVRREHVAIVFPMPGNIDTIYTPSGITDYSPDGKRKGQHLYTAEDPNRIAEVVKKVAVITDVMNTLDSQYDMPKPERSEWVNIWGEARYRHIEMDIDDNTRAHIDRRTGRPSESGNDTESFTVQISDRSGTVLKVFKLLKEIDTNSKIKRAIKAYIFGENGNEEALTEEDYLLLKQIKTGIPPDKKRDLFKVMLDDIWFDPWTSGFCGRVFTDDQGGETAVAYDATLNDFVNVDINNFSHVLETAQNLSQIVELVESTYDCWESLTSTGIGNHDRYVIRNIEATIVNGRIKAEKRIKEELDIIDLSGIGMIEDQIRLRTEKLLKIYKKFNKLIQSEGITDPDLQSELYAIEKEKKHFKKEYEAHPMIKRKKEMFKLRLRLAKLPLIVQTPSSA